MVLPITYMIAKGQVKSLERTSYERSIHFQLTISALVKARFANCTIRMRQVTCYLSWEKDSQRRLSSTKPRFASPSPWHRRRVNFPIEYRPAFLFRYQFSSETQTFSHVIGTAQTRSMAVGERCRRGRSWIRHRRRHASPRRCPN